MKLEYNYHIGPEGIVFSLIEGFDDGIKFDGSDADRMTIQKYIMLAWQEAVNKTSSGPDDIREAMKTEEGRNLLVKRAEDYLATLLETVPAELDRRHQRERRAAPRSTAGEDADRRRLRGRTGAPA